MDGFNRKKEHLLKEIGLNSENNPDASPKGTIDALCLPLIFLINSHKDMITTSSCSGRVSVFVEGSKEVDFEQENGGKVKIGAKGDGGRWLFVSHEKGDIQEWWTHKDVKLKFKELPKNKEYNIDTRYVLFKYEPLILHVQCRDFKAASRLYSVAMGCGFRESGIGANNNVAIRISVRLDVPIGYIDENGDITSVVGESYLQMITKLAYDRFLVNEEKIKKLYDGIQQEIIKHIESVEEKVETKEERKQRKMQEGLARRDEVRKLKEEKKRLKQLEAENAKNYK